MLQIENKETLVELERELRIHAIIGNHPNIVELYGMFREPQTDHLCVVMKLMRGWQVVVVTRSRVTAKEKGAVSV